MCIRDRGQFMDAVRSLTIQDIVLLPNAFRKVGGVFLSVVGGFLGWAGGQVTVAPFPFLAGRSKP